MGSILFNPQKIRRNSSDLQSALKHSNVKYKPLSSSAKPRFSAEEPAASLSSRIAQSIGAGLVTGAAFFGTVLNGILMMEFCGRRVNPNVESFILAGTPLTALIGGSAKFVELSNKKTPENSAPAMISTSAKVVESLKAGWVGYAISTVFSLGIIVMLQASNPYDRIPEKLLPVFWGASALFGLGRGIHKYQSFSKENGAGALPIPSAPFLKEKVTALILKDQSPTQQMSTSAKISKAIAAGLIASMFTFTMGVAGMILYENNVQRIPYYHHNAVTNLLIGGSLYGGLLVGATTYKNLSKTDGTPSVERKPGPTLAERWNGMSKMKKRCLIAASLTCLAAAGVLYAGPQNVADKISSAAARIRDFVYDAYDKMAYTTKSKTETKTVGEWVAGYSDQEELERLATMPPDASCAEILNTCSFSADQLKDHDKAFREKSQKFHPDKFHTNQEMNDMARKAQVNLNKAKDFIKANKKCSGQDLGHCGIFDEDMPREKALKIPNWLYRQFGAEPVCQVSFDGQPFQTVSKDQCADLI